MERQRSIRRSSRRRRRKPWTSRLKDSLRALAAFVFSNVGIVGLVVGYTIAGAFMFIAIEGAQARRTYEDVERLRNRTAKTLWQITAAQNILDEIAWHDDANVTLLEYQTDVVEAIKNGFDVTDEGGGTKQWSFSGAFLYSLTVITTIGYGNVTPRTEWGKVTTILYAIIGMPLFLLYLSNIGDILARSFKWIYAKCCLCRWCPSVAQRRAERRNQRQHWQLDHGLENGDEIYEMQNMPGGGMYVGTGESELESSESSLGAHTTIEDDAQQVTVPVTICLTIMVGYVCGGALLFSTWEKDWSFLDGSYFCFISLSTIGFGDIVPGDQIYNTEGIELSFIFCSMYLYLGMALIAMCFNLMQEEVIHKIRSVMRTIRMICRCNR